MEPYADNLEHLLDELSRIDLTEDVSEGQKEKAQKYLDRYFADLYIQVYWQDCREFAAELRTRWEAFNGGT
ncbi:TPA: hypothetical protein HA351_05905 [Methanosarcinaceae archaeon]|nr:hypothetical protein [Methanosarcinaceae archaeon]